MVYVKFSGGNGYCGCDWEEYLSFDSYDEKEFDEILNEFSRENAESYSYVATGWGEDFESEEDEEAYYDEALSYGNWSVISKEDYDYFTGN